MLTGEIPDHHQAALLTAADDLGRSSSWVDMLGVLRAAVSVLDGCRLAGLGVYDARRDVVVVMTAVGQNDAGDLDPGPIPAEGEELPFAEAAGPAVLAGESMCSAGRGDGVRRTALDERFARFGLPACARLPLRADGKLVGLLYAAFDAESVLDENALRFLETMACITTPAFVNCRNRERLTKGDKRRANLVELSHAINTSLQLDEVFTDARKAIRSIEGHAVSAIAIRHPDRDDVAVTWDIPRREGEPDAAQVEWCRASGTAFERVFDEQMTYESGDLRRATPFTHDTRLARYGVRRYTVAPMFTRGKVIGAFLFGTSDPHPALTTDVWMYENIAMQLGLAIDNARQFEQLQRLSDQLVQQNTYLREEINTEHNVEGMIGRCPAIRRVLNQVVQVAGTDSAVLILGGTGVGKELVARAIHARSQRSDHPLVKVNCAAIPENLVESELFGHEKGSFTSATSRRIGRFELARDGTLFLDEVGELPLAIQAKLLRVLQDGEFERIGGAETLETGARIIAATNRDLRDEVERGTFRSDLYYRLNVFPIHVPPLADRREDIPLLVEAFVTQFNRRMGKRVNSVHPESLDYLCQRDWPGNIRELRHVIERAMILCTSDQLVVEPADTPPGHDRATAAPGHAAPAGQGALATLDAVERDHIKQVLHVCHGVIEGAAGASAILGLKPSTLRSRMKRLGIRRG